MFLFNGLGQKIKRSLGLDDTGQPPYRKTPVRKDQASYNQQFFNATLAESAPYLPRQQPSAAKGLLSAAQPEPPMPHPSSSRNDEAPPHSPPKSNHHDNAVNRLEDSEMVMRTMNGMSNLGASMASNSGQLNPRTQTALETAIVLSQQSTLGPSQSAHDHSQNGSGSGAITVAASPSLPMVSKAMAEIATVALRQAEVFIKQKEWEKAIKACDRALAIDPTVAEAHKLMGNVLQYMGNPVDSISCYIEALVINPKYPEVYANLGTVYSTLEHWEQAFEYYQKAIDLNPEFVGAYRHLVKAWRQLNQPEGYASKIQQAMIMAPEQFGPDEHCKMGDRLLKTGKEEDAIACFNRALSQQGDYTEAHQALAQILEKQGNWEQAVNHYNQVLDTSQPTQQTKAPKRQAIADNVPLPTTEEGELTDDKDARAISIESLLSLARSYGQHGNFEKAVTHYKNALRLDPNAANVYRELADVLTQSGQTEQAVESWYRVVMLNSDWATPKRCVHVGNQLINQNQPSKAIECYRRALNLDPHFTSAQEQLNAVLNSFNQSQVETASSYSSPSSPSPSVPTAIAHPGGAMPKKSDVTSSRNAQADLTALAMDAHKQGEKLAQQERWQDAVAAYRRAIELNPDFSWSHHNLGKALFALEDWQGAVEAQRNAIALNPDFFWSHSTLGDALNQLKQQDEAAKAYQKALDIDPNCQQVICKLADVLKTIGKANLEKASTLYLKGSESEDSEEKIYREALALNPQAIDVYIKLARVLTQQNRLDEVIFTYQTARQFAPNNVEILSELGQTLFKKEQWNDAADCLHHAIEIEPDNAALHFSLGELWSHAGKLHEALQALQKSIHLNPSNHWAYQALGNVYTWMGQAEQAVAAYQQAINNKPNFAAAYKQMGDALTILGRGTDASTAYSKALEIDPSIL